MMEKEVKRESFARFQVGDVAVIVSDEKDEDVKGVVELAKKEFYDLLAFVETKRNGGKRDAV